MMQFLNQLSEDFDAAIDIKLIDSIQVLIYASFIAQSFKSYKLLDVSYFSYFEENLSLNSLSTQDLDSYFYKASSKRIINEEDFKNYELSLEHVIYETKTKSIKSRVFKLIFKHHFFWYHHVMKVN